LEGQRLTADLGKRRERPEPSSVPAFAHPERVDKAHRTGVENYVERSLLHRDGGAGILELALGLVGLVLRGALEHGLRRGLDHVLGLLQA
jgi:hypothetical protein